MEIRYSTSPQDVKRYTTKELWDEFLMEDLFEADKVNMVYSHVDRMVTGAAEEGVVIIKDENKVELGILEESNHRTICKYILPEQVESCQLVMGITSLQLGSIWNTMPCHTHTRRMEVYLYFGLEPEDYVMHYMGEPQETRHIVMRNEQAVLLPSWSIHAGAGTKSYTFIWGMAGENQAFDDMDNIRNWELM